MERQRILVCGMRFGKIYLEAILQRKDLYEVVGILGTGGKYSLEISKKYNIPLYTDIDTLPSNIDLACVILRAGALGGEGINITKKLLNAGIPVIHEQPVHHKELIECYTIAQKSNSYLEISNFYKYINSTQKYISLISRYKKTEKIEYINIECGHQVLYSVIGILLEIIENSRPFVIDAIVKDKGPFDIFFLNAASKRFAQYPNVVYQTLDIDQDFEEQNMVCESIDIVIAAGMLNNAKDTIATIRNIRNILKPGGYIIIGEPIADLLELQISQVFMMAKPIDLREKYNQIFFNEKQWRSLLMSQSFKIMHIFPEEAHMLSVLQQKLFIGRKI